MVMICYKINFPSEVGVRVWNITVWTEEGGGVDSPDRLCVCRGDADESPCIGHERVLQENIREAPQNSSNGPK